MIPGTCLPSGEFKQSAAKFLIPTQAAVSLPWSWRWGWDIIKINGGGGRYQT